MHVANIADLVWFVATDLPSPGHTLKNYLGSSGDDLCWNIHVLLPDSSGYGSLLQHGWLGWNCVGSSGEREYFLFLRDT